MTFQQLQEYASDLLDDTANGYFTLPLLKMRLNLGLKEAQKRLISANSQYYMKCVYTNTVINQGAYALPSDFYQIIRLERVTQGSGFTAQTEQIQQITPNQRGLAGDNSGLPYWYYMQQQNVILRPTPNRIVEVHLEYAYQVADMVSQGDVPDCPAQFHEYIAILATRDCLIKDGRPLAPIQSKLEQYEMLLKQIAVQRTADGPRMVVNTSYDVY